MANEIPQSHVKLATTATGGAGGEHSPYARRVLSAGYKGLIQGSIGGAALYGTFGAVIGTVVAIGLSLTPVGAAAWLAIPLIGGAGVLKGADTFGTISAQASMHAETAEMNERRRAIGDRLQETTSQKEADELVKLLHEESKETPPHEFFHWKPVLIGIAIGVALGLLMSMPPMSGVLHFVIGDLAKHIVGTAGAAMLAGTGAAIGGLAGATIGIDRYYIRQWFDTTESVVHDTDKARDRTFERQLEAARLAEIERTETGKGRPTPTPQRHVMNFRDETPPPRVRVEKQSIEAERLMTPEEALRIGL
ncbi:MAG: hypothetical protein J0M34_01985 [Alphaproteobacteria bacterium]|nr:hypothetical protein [Alphaproteobacteria bacterium]